MEIYLQQNGQQVGPYTEEQLRGLVTTGAINQFDLAIHAGLSDWQPLCTVISIAIPPPATPHLPVPTSGTLHLPAPPTSETPHLQSTPPAPDTSIPATPKSSSSPFARVAEIIQPILQRGAMIGGWACFGIGFIVLIAFSWPFYIHFILFVAAVILGIEALSQDKVIGGISLLAVTLILPVIVGFGLLFYRANKPTEPIGVASENVQAEQKTESQNGLKTAEGN